MTQNWTFHPSTHLVFGAWDDLCSLVVPVDGDLAASHLALKGREVLLHHMLVLQVSHKLKLKRQVRLLEVCLLQVHLLQVHQVYR